MHFTGNILDSEGKEIVSGCCGVEMLNGMNTSHSGNERYMVTAVDEAALIVSVRASHVPCLPCASSLTALSLLSTVPPPTL